MASNPANRQKAPGLEGRSPVRRGCGAQPREFFFDDFLLIFGKISWSSKTEFLGILNFKKTVRSVTARVSGTFQSLREVKIDVQKCIGTMTMSLNAVLRRFLGIHDRGDRRILAPKYFDSLGDYHASLGDYLCAPLADREYRGTFTS